MRKFIRFHFFLVVLILLASCSLGQGVEPDQTNSLPDQPWDFRQDLRVGGRVVLSEPINMSFVISGRMVDLLVQHGDSVKSGDVLARLEANHLEQAVFMAEANLDLVETKLNRLMLGASPSELLEAENNLIIAQATIPLNVAQVTIKTAQVSTAQSRLDNLKSLPLPEDITEAEAEVRIAQANLDLARARGLETVLIAPTDGTVNVINFKVFEFAGAGKTVITIGDPNDLSIEVLLDEVDVTAIFVGDSASITFVAIPEAVVEAVVTIVTPNQDTSSTKDFRIVLKLLEVPPGLRWGMSAEVTFAD